MAITDDKRTLRRLIAQRKKQLTAADKQAATERVAKALLENSWLRSSQHIVAYWSLPDELPTHDLVETLAISHKVYLPVIVGDRLELRRYEDREKMKAEPKFGIEEPTSRELLPQAAKDVVIITPGVAFTADGQRLGRGGGFYDRIFAQLTDAHKIGVAFECQRVDTLPVEPHDCKMDEIVFG